MRRWRWARQQDVSTRSVETCGSLARGLLRLFQLNGGGLLAHSRTRSPMAYFSLSTPRPVTAEIA